MDLSRYSPVFASDDSVRFAYLRLSALQKALENDRVVDELVRQLEVPGKPAVLKALSRGEKLDAIERQIEHFRAQKTSVWRDVHPAEVLAASIFRSSLPNRMVYELFSDVKKESALLKPVAAWLKSHDLPTYDEVPLGTKRTDALGYRKGGFFASTELVAVELKNDTEQLKRGLDQMTTFGEYVHEVWLACTPWMAAEYLDKHSEAAKVRHWDAGVLDRKMEQFGFGLLLVEGDSVYEYKEAQAREPNKKKLEEVELALHNRKPL